MTQNTAGLDVVRLPKYCGRCGLLIQAGEEYATYEHPGASAAGATVYFHAELCEKLPTRSR